jgi:hypothetical protein
VARRTASAAGGPEPAERPFGSLAADMLANNRAHHGPPQRMRRRNFGSPEASSNDSAGSPANSGKGRARCPGSNWIG